MRRFPARLALCPLVGFPKITTRNTHIAMRTAADDNNNCVTYFTPYLLVYPVSIYFKLEKMLSAKRALMSMARTSQTRVSIISPPLVKTSFYNPAPPTFSTLVIPRPILLDTVSLWVESLQVAVWNMVSTLKRRRSKMNKHKLRKRRKLERRKSH